MDSFLQYQQHLRKLFACTANVMLPEHRLLAVRTVDIGADSVKIVPPENLPERLDCLVRVAIPAGRERSHTVIAHARTRPCVFDGRHGGFLTELRFTRIPPESVQAIERYLKS
jgi:hypothetical protein